jgi:phenylpyruvate tautomerase PptA (4-oxalocrotonate tautomerase family)
MPVLNVKCSKPLPDELLQELSCSVAETIGKPEKYVMVVAETADILMAGEHGDAAYAVVRSIGGLDRIVNHELTIKICVLLNDHLGIASDRIYVTFQSVAADHWGWNQTTFG